MQSYSNRGGTYFCKEERKRVSLTEEDWRRLYLERLRPTFATQYKNDLSESIFNGLDGYVGNFEPWKNVYAMVSGRTINMVFDQQHRGLSVITFLHDELHVQEVIDFLTGLNIDTFNLFIPFLDSKILVWLRPDEFAKLLCREDRREWFQLYQNHPNPALEASRYETVCPNASIARTHARIEMSKLGVPTDVELDQIYCRLY
mgnify:CR=1 FL=1